jgi:Domain of unknown function (DUF202)
MVYAAANERTFLHWMNMSVTIGSISAALLGETFNDLVSSSIFNSQMQINCRSCTCMQVVMFVYLLTGAVTRFNRRGRAWPQALGQRLHPPRHLRAAAGAVYDGRSHRHGGVLRHPLQAARRDAAVSPQFCDRNHFKCLMFVCRCNRCRVAAPALKTPDVSRLEIGAPCHTADEPMILACRNKLDGPYDNRVLPIVLSVVMIVALSITFVGSVVSFEQSG